MNGRKTFFFIFLGVLTLVFFVYIRLGYENIWKMWDIPIMLPHFADLRGITGGAESYALGYDPMYHNPGDPWGRRMNHPRIWHGLFALGINQEHTTILGIGFIGLFFIGVFSFFQEIHPPAAIILALVTFSPAVLLGIERGNSDLVVFFLLAMAVTAGRRSSFIGTCFVLLAAILKLFPAFGLSYILRETREKVFRLCMLSVCLMGGYLACTSDDVKQMRAVTPQGLIPAYGFNVLGMGIHRWRMAHRFSSAANDIVLLPYVLIAVLCLGFLFLIFKKYDFHKFKTGPDTDAFRIGASIYMGSFMMGSNWDYRLMFLIFTVPQLARWMRAQEIHKSYVPAVVLMGIIFSCWAMKLGSRSHFVVFCLKNGSDWIVFAGLLYLFLASLPSWCREDCMRALGCLRRIRARLFSLAGKCSSAGNAVGHGGG
jgi:hypothetical protein